MMNEESSSSKAIPLMDPSQRVEEEPHHQPPSATTTEEQGFTATTPGTSRKSSSNIGSNGGVDTHPGAVKIQIDGPTNHDYGLLHYRTLIMVSDGTSIVTIPKELNDYETMDVETWNAFWMDISSVQGQNKPRYCFAISVFCLCMVILVTGMSLKNTLVGVVGFGGLIVAWCCMSRVNAESNQEIRHVVHQHYSNFRQLGFHVTYHRMYPGGDESPIETILFVPLSSTASATNSVTGSQSPSLSSSNHHHQAPPNEIV